LHVGGVDGARTRDPRRDRPVLESSIHTSWRSVLVPKLRWIDVAIMRAAAGQFQKKGGPNSLRDLPSPARQNQGHAWRAEFVGANRPRGWRCRTTRSAAIRALSSSSVRCHPRTDDATRSAQAAYRVRDAARGQGQEDLGGKKQDLTGAAKPARTLVVTRTFNGPARIVGASRIQPPGRGRSLTRSGTTFPMPVLTRCRRKTDGVGTKSTWLGLTPGQYSSGG
jgi:hypothetical protein